ncbi:MAG: T9SS type A sorting domain-containing protein, partial [Bacteroidetes bacterium]|nr:T9SS type A sorting domain-containing protein [Bacteroidota bacterium]
QLFAPNKNFVYLIWDNSNWELAPEYQLNKTIDGNRYWISLTGLTPMKEYRFQYFVDNDINIADPYSDKVLDRWNDPGINPIIYPNLLSYPIGKTSQLVSVFQTGQTPFIWTDASFQKPDNRDLVIYELLVRDFHLTHNFKTVEDSIQYIKKIGVNAVELMPVTEYDGNDSWGYMTSLHFAPDKCYGTKNMLKSLINTCHNNGIAVILDIVLNHASGQNPLARLYYNKDKQRPAPGNLWFNELIPHPFGYHCDFNHESSYTKTYIDSVLNYWATEYHADGFRLDFTKGFTNKVSVTYDANGDVLTTDVNSFGQYDINRINALKRLAGVVWQKHPGTFMILENFADNYEEKELADFGFMLWCGTSANITYNQASMGFCNNNDDFQGAVSYKARGWGNHNLIGYMESHDEERLMYRNISYGNINVIGTDTFYNTRNKITALDRMGEAAALFFTVPGPKMFWEFGERGFDYSINWPSMTDETRTEKKPPKWDYMNDPYRLLLFKKYAALIKLKINYPIFRTSNFDMNVGSYDKRIRLFDDGYVGSDMSAVVLGNFDVASKPVWPEFSHTGKWYDYFSGDSLDIQTGQTVGNNFTLQYNPGEYHIYTDVKLPLPDLYVDTTIHQGISEIIKTDNLKSFVYPNPFSTEQTICYNLPVSGKVILKVYNVLGTEIKTLQSAYQQAGVHYITWDGTNNFGEKIKSGYYYYYLSSGNYSSTNKIAFVKE